MGENRARRSRHALNLVLVTRLVDRRDRLIQERTNLAVLDRLVLVVELRDRQQQRVRKLTPAGIEDSQECLRPRHGQVATAHDGVFRIHLGPPGDGARPRRHSTSA